MDNKINDEDKELLKEINKEKKKRSAVDLGKPCHSFSLMLYVDQIGHRNENLPNETQVSILKDWLNNLEVSDDIIYYGIVHYKNITATLGNGFNDVFEKPHIHIAFNMLKNVRPITLIKELGLDFDSKLDSFILSHDGFRYINLRRHELCKTVIYFLHETDQAKLEMKPEYDASEIITNDRSDFYDNFTKEYDYYHKDLYINRFGQVNQLSEEDALFDILDRVYHLGYELGNYDVFLKTLPRRYIYKYLSKIQSEYFRGVQNRYKNKISLNIHRCAIYIYGPPGCGKTYGSLHTLNDLGRSVYQVGQSSGTGGEDNIMPYDCLVYDDRIPKNCLDKADVNVCELYRRNSGNGLFGGDYFIINHNRDFNDAFKNYYKDKDDVSDALSPEAYALKTRFYIVQVTLEGAVIVKSRCTRGLTSDRSIIDKKFEAFISQFKSYIKQLYDEQHPEGHEYDNF